MSISPATTHATLALAPLAQAAPASQWVEWAILVAVAGVAGGVSAVVMRFGTVAGPPRLAPAERLHPLLVVTLLGLAAWMLIPGVYAAAVGAAPQPAPATTAPGTQPAPVFTPRQSVIVSVVAGLGAAAVLLVVNLARRPGGLSRLGFSWRALPRGAMLGVLAALLVVPLTMVAAVLTDHLWRLVGLEHPGAHEMLRILDESEAPDMRGMIYLSAVLVAPLFEELLFRGHVQTLLVGMFALVSSPAAPVQHTGFDPFAPEPSPQPEQPPGDAVLSYATPAPRPPVPAGRGVRWAAILIASALFTLVHGELWMMPPIFFLSLCVGYVYERTGNLWSAITVHLVFNLVNVSLFVNWSGS